MPTFYSVFCLFLILVLLWVVAFYWLPEMGRAYSITRMYGARDRLYAMAARHPSFARTNLYRDLEFIYAASIHLVRDRTWGAALRYFFVITSRPIDEARAERRAHAYREEMAGCFGADSKGAWEEIDGAFAQHHLAIIIRACSGHPLIAAPSATMLVAAYIWMKFVRPVSTLVEAALTIERSPHRPAVA